MINVIIFMGMLEGPDYYLGCFIKYLKAHSIAYYVVDAKKPESYLSKEFDDFASRPNTVMFTMNSVGLWLREGNENYWKKHDIPVFDHIVDHPRYYGDGMFKPECDLYVFTLDKDHKVFIERFYPDIKETFFLPNGGTEVNKQEEYEKRSIDVIYMGSCGVNVEFTKAEEFEDGGTEFYTESICYLLEHPMSSTEEAIESFFKNRNLEISDEKLLELNIKYARPIENQVRRHYKLEGMKALDEEGVHVDIYGKGWEDDDYSFSDNISLHGRIKRGALMDLIGKSKISICYIPWFKKGCSEKNFDSLLNGALCVTDKSEYLEEHYKDGYNIIYFDLNNPKQMAVDIKWLLENPKEAELIARRGYETARKYDTWNCRFDIITGVMQKVLDNNFCG